MGKHAKNGIEIAFEKLIDGAVDRAVRKHADRIEKLCRERDHYLTPSDIAKILQVSKPTVLKWLNSGSMECQKFGPHGFRVRPSELQRFLESYTYKRKQRVDKVAEIPKKEVVS